MHSRVWLIAINLIAEDSNPILIGRFRFCSKGEEMQINFQDVDFKIVKEIPVLNRYLWIRSLQSNKQI